MNAVELFEQLGVLYTVLWTSADGAVVKIDKHRDSVVHTQVRLPFCGTWIKDSSWSVEAFLSKHKPLR